MNCKIVDTVAQHSRIWHWQGQHNARKHGVINGIVCKSTPVGFEPTRGDPIGLAGRRLGRSAKVSSGHQCPTECAVQVDACDGSAVGGQWAAAKQNLRSTCAHSANRSQGVISTMAPLESVQVWTAALHALSANNTCGIRAHAGRPHRLSGPTP